MYWAHCNRFLLFLQFSKLFIMIKNLPLHQIRTDLNTQMRIETNTATVDGYVEAMERGDEFPPIVVFLIDDVYALADGFHRLAAYMQLGRDTIPCEIIRGTIDDAREYACCTNSKHGLPRTSDDKRKAVEEFFSIRCRDDLSNNEIAKKLGVSGPFVKNVRESLGIKASPAAHHGKGSEKWQEERLNGLILNLDDSQDVAGLNGLISPSPHNGDKINVELPVGDAHQFAVALVEYFDLKYLRSCTKNLVEIFKNLT